MVLPDVLNDPVLEGKRVRATAEETAENLNMFEEQVKQRRKRYEEQQQLKKLEKKNSNLNVEVDAKDENKPNKKFTRDRFVKNWTTKHPEGQNIGMLLAWQCGNLKKTVREHGRVKSSETLSMAALNPPSISCLIFF